MSGCLLRAEVRGLLSGRRTQREAGSFGVPPLAYTRRGGGFEGPGRHGRASRSTTPNRGPAAHELSPGHSNIHAHVGPLSTVIDGCRTGSQHPRARRPSNPHVHPLIRAWAVPPTLHIAGLRATERVTARNSGFTCDQHATTETDPAKTQTHSATTIDFGLFSPNGSALWRPHHLEPRPRRPQAGELHDTGARYAGDTPQEGFV